jgi:hypothetical protein
MMRDSRRMKRVVYTAAALFPVEVVGIFTLLTNDGIIPAFDLGFSIPVLLFSSDVQGLSLLFLSAGVIAMTVVREAR